MKIIESLVIVQELAIAKSVLATLSQGIVHLAVVRVVFPARSTLDVRGLTVESTGITVSSV